MNKKIFIHIPKNGGMTLRHSNLNRGRIITATPEVHKSAEYTQQLHSTMKANNDHHGNEHARWRDLNPEVTANYDAFAIIRNPWDRVVSRYFFARKVIYVEKKSPESYIDCTSFEAFLDSRHIWGDKEFFWHRAIRGWYPAFDHVSDEAGNVRCDIIRLEHFQDDINKYFGTNINFRQRNVTALNESTYQDMYNEKTIQIIADWYKKDIDYWGFDFDTPAQKNYWSENG